jgi:hypothetical protein
MTEEYHRKSLGKPRNGGEWILYRIISRRSWDELQRHRAEIPGSAVEHLLHGLYVLTLPERTHEATHE